MRVVPFSRERGSFSQSETSRPVSHRMDFPSWLQRLLVLKNADLYGGYFWKVSETPRWHSDSSLSIFSPHAGSQPFFPKYYRVSWLQAHQSRGGFHILAASQVTKRKESVLPLFISISGLLVYIFCLKFKDWIKSVNKLS